MVSAFEMAAMILYEAGVGFLGLSVPPTIPSWGNVLADGRNYLTTSWWIAMFPELAILVGTLGDQSPRQPAASRVRVPRAPSGGSHPHDQ